MIKVRLRELAEAKGYTRSTLSAATHISYPTVLLFWNDNVKKIDVDILDRLCEFLNCEPGDLIQRVPDETTVTPTP